MNLKHLFIIPAVVLSFSACSDDNGGDEPTPVPDPTEVKIVSTSVAEGSEVDASITGITVTYNTDVEVNRQVAITLNGERVSVAASGDKSVTVAVTLTEGTEYRLVIPDRAIIADRGLSYGPALTLNFRTAAAAVPPAPQFAALTNPSATPQAVKVYSFLAENNGKKILSGAMAEVNNNNTFAEWIFNVTGKYPALTGYDFIHLPDSKPGAWIDYSDISAAKSQWDNNGLVSYMWHWNAPSTEADYRDGKTGKYGFYAPGKGDSSTEFDIREALKEGTWQHEFILADIDRVAGYLKLLQDEGIPVIWRPLHEAAGDYRYGAWFWWGRYGDQYTKELWILMHERLVKHHGLNNLIWVWTAQYQSGNEAKMKESYPGDDYVDIVGVDLYPSTDHSQVEAWRAANELTSGKKIVTLSEIGRLPDPAKCMQDGAAWSWFMIWYTYKISSNAAQDDFGNTPESLRKVMSSPYVINRDQMPSLK